MSTDRNILTMQFSQVTVNTLALLFFVITGCSGSGNTEIEKKSTVKSNNRGTLILVANGEDFVRQGFVTKDDWQVDFERVTINPGNAIAFSTASAFDPEQSKSIQEVKSQEQVTILDKATTVDLAAGNENAKPITVKQLLAPDELN